jgi:adenylate cyclase
MAGATTIRSASATGVPAEAAAPVAERRLFAIAHADMVGYSRLIGLDDRGTIARLKQLRQSLIEPAIQSRGGRLIQTAGDSFLVTFESVTEAVEWALEVQRRVPILDKEQPPERRMRFRVGIEMGDVIADGPDLHGDSVNVAVRLQAACPPGGICVSGAVHDHVKCTIEVEFRHIGLLKLKNILRPVDAFVALLDTNGCDRWTVAMEGAVSVDPNADAPAPVFATSAGGPPLLAVLPFQQFGDDAVPSHVSDGMLTDIVCQLAGLHEIGVISYGSTLGLHDRVGDLRSIGRQLGARYIVRGAFRHAGNHTRLTAELTDAETGTVTWARTLELGNFLSFESQDLVVGQIVNTLAPRVRDVERHRIRGKRPDSLSVYEKVLMAREGILKLQREEFFRAKDLLDQVVVDEPEYAEAYSLSADWHGLLVGQGWSLDRAKDVAAVDRLARRALSLDQDNVRALVCYGHRKSLLHRDYPAALEMFRRALHAAPSSAHALLKSSYTFAYIGEADEAVRRAERALLLSPCDYEPHLFYSALCVAHYTAGHYDVAAEWGRRTIWETTKLRNTAAWAAASLAALGRIAEAQEIAAMTKDQWPHRRVQNAVARHPYQDAERRRRYGEHLLAAGFPP